MGVGGVRRRKGKAGEGGVTPGTGHPPSNPLLALAPVVRSCKLLAPCQIRSAHIAPLPLTYYTSFEKGFKMKSNAMGTQNAEYEKERPTSPPKKVGGRAIKKRRFEMCIPFESKHG